MVLGIAVWLLGEGWAPEALIPPQLAGLGASLMGMVAGSLLEARQKGGQRLQPAP